MVVDHNRREWTATDVAEAIFSSSFTHYSRAEPHREAVQEALETFRTALETAGFSFAEYLDRIRQHRGTTAQEYPNRWRYSARERALQQVDHAVAHLCHLLHPQQGH